MGDRPNPVKGRTLRIRGEEFRMPELSFEQVLEITKSSTRANVLAELGVPVLLAGPTPSSRWFLEGREDTFPNLINKERGDLCLGDHTDDELANEVFLYGDMSSDDKHRAIMSGRPSSIVYLTAGKERIRWLSRHLEASLGNEKALQAQVVELQARIKELEEQAETLQGDLSEAYARADM